MTAKIKIIMLGTGSHIPSVKKNHTAVLLCYEGENILVDCGEGTQRQFRYAKLNPCKITRLLITHWHGDHVLGIPGILQTLALSDYRKTLFIYGPSGTKLLMRALLNLFNFKQKYKIKVEEVDKGKFVDEKNFYLESEKMEHGISCNAYSFVKKGQVRIDKEKLKKAKLDQGPHLSKLKQGKDIKYKSKKYLAKNLTYTEGDKKISIVMDTLDNKKIIPFVKGADLLICESSFNDAFKDKAREYHHSTAKQVANNAKKANAKKLVLTHLSGRWDKNPQKILNEAKKVFKNSVLAKDLDVFGV
ncbi:MAG: ribonuclease Z [Nanoarchaeota archaeon]|nr:ribonuclease Z [Nanoarchaeota archaeon]MBU1028254.1 ribonuclease Z [Nanoarchaeota archaeon]